MSHLPVPLARHLSRLQLGLLFLSPHFAVRALLWRHLLVRQRSYEVVLDDDKSLLLAPALYRSEQDQKPVLVSIRTHQHRPLALPRPRIWTLYLRFRLL